MKAALQMSLSHQEECKSSAIWKVGIYRAAWGIFPLGTKIPSGDAQVSQ